MAHDSARWSGPKTLEPSDDPGEDIGRMLNEIQRRKLFRAYDPLPPGEADPPVMVPTLTIREP